MTSSSTLAVCSWSLHPTSAADLVAKVKQCGVSAVQLAVDPIRLGHWEMGETQRTLRDAGIAMVSAMMGTEGEDYSTLESIARTGGIRPDATWGANLANAKRNAEICAALGLKLITLHAGFLPHERNDPERGKLISRLRMLADVFAAKGVRIAFETGQESAATLLEVLKDLNHANIGVNFDPANMILYNMGEPLEAVKMLAPYVRQIHIKDATYTAVPGTWGAEVPVGTGRVPWAEFIAFVKQNLPAVDLCIEREAGDQRVSDIRTAADLISRLRS
ncbi:MAG: sugar phosphate isomerase/epimerase [Planctomycetes bacterium]|nr:sugar phosphate isomerase/epimerase [Planctomycetota bacterium]